jgi:predicted outer membrane protein
MHSNRHAVPARTSTRTIAIIAAVCAVVAAVVIAIRAGGGEASANQTASGQARHAGGHALDAGAAGQAGAAQGGTGDLKVTDVDREFLVKVRQAGLWEIPAGRLAQTNAHSEAVKRAGQHLLDGHSKLDQLVREDAEILGVELPNEATEEQQEWVRQLENSEGKEFDRLFANVLRASHGKIFATIGEVRAATQNDLIRRHARQANQTVLDHMEVLEDTGLVDGSTFQEVEEAVAPK